MMGGGRKKIVYTIHTIQRGLSLSNEGEVPDVNKQD